MKIGKEIKKIFGRGVMVDKKNFDSMIYAVRITPDEAQNSPVEKHKPIVYQIYDYLKKNAVGYEKRIKSNELMEYFNIPSNEIFRSYIQEIRQSDVLQKIVCSQAGLNGGYWIATNEEEVTDTLNHLYNRAMEMLKTYSIIKRKARLDGQIRIKMSKYEREVIESILRG